MAAPAPPGSDSPVSEALKATFPFEPYPAQVSFMEHLYEALDRGAHGVGVFESPTGTGKSLSILVSSLHWLLERAPQQLAEEKVQEAVEAYRSRNRAAASSGDGCGSEKVHGGRPSLGEQPSWVNEQAMELEKKKTAAQLASSRVHKRQPKHALTSQRNYKKSKTLPGRNDGGGGRDDAQFLVDIDWDPKLLDGGDDDPEEKMEQMEDIPKIIYCSRTHSQLSQFVQELKLIPAFRDRVRCVSLGGRQNLCINGEVKVLASKSAMNDACLDKIQDRKKDASKGCPYLTESTQRQFVDAIHQKTLDIEEILAVGKENRACPYYGTRRAVAQSHLVTVPYASLMHKSTRESLGIKLSGNVVIIDEAHNLTESINQVYSTVLSYNVTKAALGQLDLYFQRYKQRLKPTNRIKVETLLSLLKSLVVFLSPTSVKAFVSQKSPSAEARLIEVTEFTHQAKIGNFNPFELVRYVEAARLTQKLKGFVDKYNESNDKSSEENQVMIHNRRSRPKKVDSKVEPEISRHSSPLSKVIDFLKAIGNASVDGRVVVRCATEKESAVARSSPTLQYVLMNPADHFKEIVDEARAVVLAGGTMKPFDLLLQQLKVGEQRPVTLFSCGHVVSADNVLALAVPRGPNQHRFDFRFGQRSKPEQLMELGRTLVNICTVVPAGLVCFFPSYSFEEEVFKFWKNCSILEQIEKRKSVFREPRAGGGVDTVLSAFSEAIKSSGSGGGALLSCVVGGKMSEGINFSNDMARCVVMVGLPYANPHEPLLKEKMAFLTKNIQRSKDQLPAGKEFYENLCLRAVNQSIGRSIRNKDDYSTIVLLDHRYATQRVSSQLPKWILKSFHELKHFGQAHRALSKFFKNREVNQQVKGQDAPR